MAMPKVLNHLSHPHYYYYYFLSLNIAHNSLHFHHIYFLCKIFPHPLDYMLQLCVNCFKPLMRVSFFVYSCETSDKFCRLYCLFYFIYLFLDEGGSFPFWILELFGGSLGKLRSLMSCDYFFLFIWAPTSHN